MLCIASFCVWFESDTNERGLIEELIFYDFKLGHLLFKRGKCSWSEYRTKIVEEIYKNLNDQSKLIKLKKHELQGCVPRKSGK